MKNKPLVIFVAGILVLALAVLCVGACNALVNSGTAATQTTEEDDDWDIDKRKKKSTNTNKSTNKGTSGSTTRRSGR